MKSVNKKLMLVVFILLISLEALTMIIGCKNKGGAEQPEDRPADVEQQEEDIGEDW